MILREARGGTRVLRMDRRGNTVFAELVEIPPFPSGRPCVPFQRPAREMPAI